MKRQVLSLAAVLAVAGWAAGAQADDVVCDGDTIAGETIDGNVIVTGPCTLAGVTVKGNVEVEGGGSLQLFAPSEIDGNVQSDGADFVLVFGNGVTIGGDLQIKNTGPWGSGYVEGTVIDGNVQYEENTAPLVALGGAVGGDVQLFENSGGAFVGMNAIDGNLQCKENAPAPSPFGVNRVDGNKEDQCAEDLGF